MFRPINQTVNQAYTHPVPVTDAIVDLRAFAFRAAIFGRPATASETLAETIVRQDMLAQVGEALLNPMFFHRAIEVLFPKDDAKLTEGQGMFVFPMLVDAFKTAIPKLNLDGANLPDTKAMVTTLAHVFGDLTSQALSKRHLMLPTEGHISLLTSETIFPTMETIKEAIMVKQLADVLDTLNLDPQLGRVKTTTVAALRAMMGPAMAAAGRRIMTLATMPETFEDVVTLVGMYLRRSADLPKRLENDLNLQALASNMTIVSIAMKADVTQRVLYNPDYSFAQILGEVSRLIRDNPRFSIRSLREIKEYYSHVTVRDNAHRIAGLVVGRNGVFNYKAQATVFTQIASSQSPLWAQSPQPGVEAVIDGFVGPLNGMSTASTLQTVANIASLTERRGVALTYGMSEDELMYYAAATAQEVVLTLSEDGQDMSFMFMNADSNEPVVYDSGSVYFGDTILSQDPAEAIIHAGVREHYGNKHYEAKSQLIPVDFRKATFFTNPEEIANSLAETVTASIVLADDSILTTSFDTARLLRLTTKTDVKLTNSPMNSQFLDGYITTLLSLLTSIGSDVPEHVRTAALTQTAMAINNVLAKVYGSASAKAFSASISRFFLNSAVVGSMDETVIRSQLNRGLTSVQLQMLSATVLLRLFGLLTVSSTEILALMEESHLNQYLISARDTHLAID